MKKLTGYIRVPNWIDDDIQMYDSTKLVLFALLASVGSRMTVCISQDQLAALSGCCRNTVAKALRELTERGILFSTRRYYYSRCLKQVVRGKTRYYLRRCGADSSFTLVPRELLAAQMTPAEFTAALHAYRLAGRTGRCCPSLRRFASQIDHAKSTVCRAMKKLHLRQVISKLKCLKKNNAYACNSYYPTAWVRKKGAGAGSLTGGRKFEQPQVINKITEGFYFEGKNKGVGEFGNLYNFEGLYFFGSFFDRPFFFDGTGVKVSANSELDLTG